ncbi:MAG: hypothetical protein ACXVBO_21630 [Isosphaeraceae bacterium]
MAMGFFDIADAAVERWKAGHRNDLIVIPIIYNYRHGIELALKDQIREASACLREDGATDRDVQADEVDRWVSATHSIRRLVNRLTTLLGRLPLGPDQQLPAETPTRSYGPTARVASPPGWNQPRSMAWSTPLGW